MNSDECVCIRHPELFDYRSPVCRNCRWYLVAGALGDHEFIISRKEFIDRLIAAGHTKHDSIIVDALVRQYSCSRRAAELAFRRARRKAELVRTDHSDE